MKNVGIISLLLGLVWITPGVAQGLAKNVDRPEQKNAESWLTAMFPDPNNCVPKSPFYFDINTKQSYQQVLEKRGYIPFDSNTMLATYAVKESFYGFAATSIAIPTENFSLFVVNVNANAKTLAKRIREKTGTDIVISNGKTKPKSGAAHIVPGDGNTSSFTCLPYAF